MCKKSILIIEDNISSMKMLEKLIGEINSKIVCLKASNLSEAYHILHSNQIDVFIIDIILDTKKSGDLSGIELAKEIREIDRYKFTPIIFITSVEDPRLYAYEYLHSYGYIIKPYHVETTRELIVKALEYEGKAVKDKTVCLIRDGVLFPVKEKDIMYVESKFHVLTVHTKKENLEFPYKTCRQIMELLDENVFVKCNRNTIINAECINNIDTVNRYALLKCEGEEGCIKVGKKYMKELINKIIKAKIED